MSMANQCSLENREELAAQFAGARLAPAEYDAFGVHLLACAECRALVAEAADLRAAFRTRARRRRAVLVTPVTGAAAAAVIAWIALTPSAVQRLGAVYQAPGVTPMEVRATADSAAAFAVRGVDAYRKQEYDQAVRWLSRAYAEHEDAGTAFLLGASLLMNGAADSAVVAFGQVIRVRQSVYSPEAHFYRAKAWLQLERPDSAAMDLMSAAASPNAPPRLRERATELLDRLKRLE